MGVGVNRPTIDAYFLNIAKVVATRSTCKRHWVGAVAVKDKRILSTGYNGTPSGLKHCLDTGCLRDQLGIPSGEKHEVCRGVHAEQNVIIQAAISGASLMGSTVYATHTPCQICAKMLVNAGIKRYVYLSDYDDEEFRELFKEAKVELEHYMIY